MRTFFALIAALLLFGCLVPQPAPTPTPSATPTTAPTASVIPSATAFPTPSPAPTLPASANPAVAITSAPSDAEFSKDYPVSVALAFDAPAPVLPSVRLTLYDNGVAVRAKEVPNGANSTFSWVAGASGSHSLRVSAEFLLADGKPAAESEAETNVTVRALEFSDYANHSSVVLSEHYVDAQRFVLYNQAPVAGLSAYMRAPEENSSFVWLRVYAEEFGKPGPLLFERFVNTTELPREFGWFTFNVSRMMEKGAYWAGMYVRDSYANVSWAMYNGTVQSVHTFANVREWVSMNGTFFVRVS